MIQLRRSGRRAARSGPGQGIAILYCWLVGLLLVVASVHAEPPAAPVIKAGVLNDNYPFSFSSYTGNIEGFVVDLLAEIENVTELRLERHIGGTREINRAFEEGRLSLLQSYARSPEREAFAEFSQPYLKMNGSIFVRKGEHAIRSLADLKGRRVMVHRGSKGEEVLRAAGLEASIVHVDSVEESLRRLDAGECDATLVGRLSGLATAHHLGLRQVVPVGDPIYEVDYCFAVRKGNEALLRQIDEALLILRQPGGAYESIYRKWFGQLGGYSRGDVLLAVTVGLAIALLVALWAFYHQRTLHHRIRRQAEELKASEERYREVFESSLDALLVLSPIPNSSSLFKITRANPRALHILQLEALPASDIFLGQALLDGAELEKRISAALAPSARAIVEYERPKGSAPLWLRISVGRMGERILAVLADITEAKNTEERMRKHDELLRQHQKLEAIGTMASGVAHDFNNILAGIVGYAELTRMDLPEDHMSRTFIAEILGCSNRAQKLVRQILTFSRKGESRREIIAAKTIIDEVVDLLHATAPKSIELVHQPAREPCIIEADPTQLHQVLLNLCTNAVHAMHNKPGRVEIIEESMEIRPEENGQHGRLTPGHYVHISVKDSGSGMTPEVLQRIFEPFFTTKPPGEGTGLGLSVVHGILQSHGGDITVYSKPGQGTIFHLYLPAATQKVATTPPMASVPHGHGEPILIVDDEAAITQAVRLILIKIGYSPVPFNDPETALGEFRRNPTTYKAVLCDFTMPKLSGLDLAAQISSVCPFILVSGYIGEVDKERASKLGVFRVIEKPVDLPTLATALAECLNQPKH